MISKQKKCLFKASYMVLYIFHCMKYQVIVILSKTPHIIYDIWMEFTILRAACWDWWFLFTRNFMIIMSVAYLYPYHETSNYVPNPHVLNCFPTLISSLSLYKFLHSFSPFSTFNFCLLILPFILFILHIL